MRQKYTKMEELAEIIFERKAAGETNRQIGESFGLTKKQVKGLISRQNRKQRQINQGRLPRPKGRPRKKPEDEESKRNKEIAELRMQVDLLRNFLLEVGRR